MPTHLPSPIELVRGQGLMVWDKQGKKYLDTFSGLAVLPLGHAHPSIVKTIVEQSSQLMHTSNALSHSFNISLAKALYEWTGLPRAFFCVSGAEANEAAIKLARRYGHSKNIAKPKVLVFEQGYHGRTMATLTATGFRWAHAGFEPLVDGFARASYDDLDSVRRVLAEDSDVVAILVEPILGAGGVIVPSDNFLPGLRTICDEHDLLLICDEVQCGLGRVGHFLQSQALSVQPDIVTLAKGLAGGYPIGACLATQAVSDLFTPGSHGSTFGGNPLACACALAFLKTLSQENLIEHTRKQGQALIAKLSKALSAAPSVESISGRGLMIGIHLNQNAKPLIPKAAELGVLINVANQNTIRLLPAFIISDEQIEQIVAALSRLLIP
ncbi:MAG: aspartate aminotransferase family protein [Legionellales bacterium]|nr:aspartate aminotransferase family protein [Legionellales bacterium]